MSANNHDESFFATLLTPGSSLHPTFLLMLDGAFSMLLGIFLLLLWQTQSLHMFVLIGIELALWASIKWFIAELSVIHAQEQHKLDLKLQTEANPKEKVS